MRGRAIVDFRPSLNIASAVVNSGYFDRSLMITGLRDSMTRLATDPLGRGRLVSQLIPSGLTPSAVAK
jgi:hypothetical protein